MAGKLGKINAKNYTLQEAMAKVEDEAFAGTKILEDPDAKFI